MTRAPEEAACIGCGAGTWMPLPDPGPQSMASDWRVVAEPLRRRGCVACGLAVREASQATTGLYAEGYSLYDHPAGGAFERSRQSQYASWIAAAVGRAPRRLLDVGCGNGSLLLALGERWPSAELLGCDPSGESVTSANASGVTAWQGTADSLEAAAADLVVAVNVVEHTADPVAFLDDLRRACAPGGIVVVICPDGGRPGVELLFADHLFSLAPPHLARLAARAGLVVRATATAPAALGDFQMIVAAPGDARVAAGAEPGAATLNGRRVAYLRRWAELDDRLADRLPDSVVCFGVGEAAGLLRAYAPRSWARVRACTADTLASNSFGPLPAVPLERVPAATALLAGVRPAAQAAIASRLGARFASVTTWYDLVQEPA